MRRRIVAAQSNSDEEALINLTPLIDVVFVMLIMFIVVAPILELDQVELARGGAQAKELSSSNQENRSIMLHIKKDNTVFLNKQQITLSKLTA